MNGVRPLLVTQDPDLIDDVLRLAAAGSVEVHLAPDAEGARSAWALAPLVLVGADRATALAAARLPRRRDVVVVSRDPSPDDWQVAVTLGAEHVARLPDAERWIIDRLADSGEGAPRNGAIIAVVGAGGGAGASTLAVTLSLAAAAQGSRTLLVDADPLGGGIDLLLGAEDLPGVRWADLTDTRGRLSATTLQQHLPSIGGVSVLSWGRDGTSSLPADAVASVLDAGERGSDLVIVDVARCLDASSDVVLARAHDVLLVTTPHVRAAAAASRLAETLQARSTSVRAVLRADARGIDEDAVTSAIGLPVAARLPHTPALVRCADDGEPPPVRDAYGRAVARLVADLVPGHGRVA